MQMNSGRYPNKEIRQQDEMINTEETAEGLPKAFNVSVYALCVVSGS